MEMEDGEKAVGALIGELGRFLALPLLRFSFLAGETRADCHVP